MESKHKELGFLASAIFAAGFMTSATVQAETPPRTDNAAALLSPDQFKNQDSSVAVRVFPFPKLTGGPFTDATRNEQPQFVILLPSKRYYEQKDNHSFELAPGVTGKLKGPARVRVTIAF